MASMRSALEGMLEVVVAVTDVMMFVLRYLSHEGCLFDVS